MSINVNCTERVKPKLLREQKTEALLVFIRTTLEQYFIALDSNKINGTIGTQENTIYINCILKKLLESLQLHVVNSMYLRNLAINPEKNPSIKLIIKKEEPLIVYYDTLIKCLENNLDAGTNWIPELMVIALLSEWIVEEEQSTYLYPFLNNIDYLDLLERYDLVRIEADDDKKKLIIAMYKLSSNLIKSLKNKNYKINLNRKKKK
jgi:hypothetical protein